ncbi:MAG: M48 family metalloprotease [Kiritimatiellae bacterium]|nr:M48 family metalloprotease [Kiritimatiellia bacterium]
MSDTPAPAPAPDDDLRARRYESLHNRLFLLRAALTLGLVWAYLLTGASAALAAGLHARFGGWWPLVNGLYTLITLFGFSALMFPLSYFSDYVIERRYGLSHQSPEGWFLDYLKTLGLELLLGVVFFSVLYALLRWLPGSWWVWATVFYVFFAVVLSSLAPVLILPLFHRIEPLDQPELVAAAEAQARQAGVRVLGVFRWGLEEKTETANAALAGLGRTRRILLGDTLLKGYSRDEILSILAHELGHYRHRDIARLIAAGTILAALGFFAAQAALKGLVAGFGFAGPADIASFPLMIVCLFLFSLIAMPFSNAYSRRRELAADAYAVRATGSAGPLVSALNKLAAQNLAVRRPAAWLEFLLYSHPSIDRRIEQAQAAEKAPGETARHPGA